mmetsp:Transcript_136638/g.323725  ORF Transcript_136638/g.323725 Transcript_136638/m.323725 type:complete len:286 (-) Transcript_136638:642-1499(-)
MHPLAMRGPFYEDGVHRGPGAHQAALPVPGVHLPVGEHHAGRIDVGTAIEAVRAFNVLADFFWGNIKEEPAQVQGPLDGVVAPGEGAVGPLLAGLVPSELRAGLIGPEPPEHALRLGGGAVHLLRDAQLLHVLLVGHVVTFLGCSAPCDIFLLLKLLHHLQGVHRTVAAGAHRRQVPAQELHIATCVLAGRGVVLRHGADDTVACPKCNVVRRVQRLLPAEVELLLQLSLPALCLKHLPHLLVAFGDGCQALRCSSHGRGRQRRGHHVQVPDVVDLCREGGRGRH